MQNRDKFLIVTYIPLVAVTNTTCDLPLSAACARSSLLLPTPLWDHLQSNFHLPLPSMGHPRCKRWIFSAAVQGLIYFATKESALFTSIEIVLDSLRLKITVMIIVPDGVGDLGQPREQPTSRIPLQPWRFLDHMFIVPSLLIMWQDYWT